MAIGITPIIPPGLKAPDKHKAVPTPKATTLSPREIAGFAAGAGFKGVGLVRAVAVALAESGGKTNARNVNGDGTVDRGLMQFNSKWHPEVSDAEADNPAAAMKAAYRVSNHGKDWSQWATWPGAAAGNLGKARMAAKNPADVADSPWWAKAALKAVEFGAGLSPFTDDLAGGTDWRDTLKKAVTLLAAGGAWLSDPHNWLRVALVTAGGAGLVTGLVLIGKSGAAGDGAKRAAGTVTGAAKGAATLAGPGKFVKAGKLATGAGKATKATKAATKAKG